MTLFKYGLGDGSISPAELFDGHNPKPILDSSTSVREALNALAHGGWPRDHNLMVRQVQRHLRDYIDNIINIGIDRLDGESRRDPLWMRVSVQSLAWYVPTEASFAITTKDVSRQSLSAGAAVAHINALKRLFIVEEQLA